MANFVSSIPKRLEGKVAIVTGGASGIGASTAALFHLHGARVVIADIQDDLGRALAHKLGNDVIYTHCDVTDEDQITHLVDSAVAELGHLDIMYSNAGVFNGDDFKSILDADKEKIERILRVNLVGGLLVAKHAARVMVPNRKGCILFTASACTEIAGIAPYSYTASKFGIVGLTKGLAVEMGLHGIRVNCVSPFGVLTGSTAHDGKMADMFEKMMGHVGNLKGKILTAEDVAKAALYLASDEAALYLASDEAAYVSGVNFVVDGGYSVVNPTLSNVIHTSLIN